MTVDNPAPAAGWYTDPAGVAEMRYWDGRQWTEHVATEGRQSTSPLPRIEPKPVDHTAPAENDTAADDDAAFAPAIDLSRVDAFTVLRVPHARDDEERGLDVYGGGNWLGRFVPTLDGSPGYRLEVDGGETALSVRKPSLKNEVKVERDGGESIGAIVRIGRLHSRYDVMGDAGKPIATVKLAAGGDDIWDVRATDDQHIVGTVVRRIGDEGDDPTRLSGADYQVLLRADADDHVRRLSFAVPVAIDILDTQVAHTAL